MRHRDRLFEVVTLLIDGDYTGENFRQGVAEILVALVEVAKRPELHNFAVMPKRWVVERSFAWLEKCQRLWKNCECKFVTSMQFVVPVFRVMLLRRR